MKLEQIRRFLSNEKATVMVGSGFSKNAIMDDGVEMLDWPELCVRFYKELYSKSLSTWNEFISSSVIPADISKGFHIGKTLAEMNTH